MKKSRALLISLTVLLFILMLFPVAASAASENGIDFFPNLDAFNGNYTKYPMVNYVWDKHGLLAGWDAFYILAKGLLFFSVVLARFSAFLLTLGFHPQMIGDFLATMIVQAIQQAKISFQPRVIPFVFVGIITALLYDLYKQNTQRMLNRVVSFLIILGVLVGYQQLTTVGIQDTTDAVSQTSSAFSGALVGMAAPLNGEPSDGQVDFLKTETDIMDITWKMVIEDPWQLGEFGQIDGTLGDDLPNVQKAVGNINLGITLTKDTRWADVVLSLPEGSDQRNALVDILNDSNHKTSQAVFSGLTRFLLSIGIVFGCLLSLPFIALTGGILIVLYLYLLAGILAGVVVIPLALIPFAQTPRWVQTWLKMLLFSALGSVVVSLALGFVFFIVALAQRAISHGGANGVGYLMMIILNDVWYALALVSFFFLYKRFEPIKKFNNAYDRRSQQFMSRNGVRLAKRTDPPRQVGKRMDRFLHATGDRVFDTVTFSRRNKKRGAPKNQPSTTTTTSSGPNTPPATNSSSGPARSGPKTSSPRNRKSGSGGSRSGSGTSTPPPPHANSGSGGSQTGPGTSNASRSNSGSSATNTPGSVSSPSSSRRPRRFKRTMGSAGDTSQSKYRITRGSSAKSGKQKSPPPLAEKQPVKYKRTLDRMGGDGKSRYRISKISSTKAQEDKGPPPLANSSRKSEDRVAGSKSITPPPLANKSSSSTTAKKIKQQPPPLSSPAQKERGTMAKRNRPEKVKKQITNRRVKRHRTTDRKR